MARPRKQLSQLLRGITSNVYYQPPESVRLVYPCIIYTLARLSTDYADNVHYRDMKQYDVVIISQTPDPEILDQMLYTIPFCRLDRAYTASNLYHYACTLYF